MRSLSTLGAALFDLLAPGEACQIAEALSGRIGLLERHVGIGARQRPGSATRDDEAQDLAIAAAGSSRRAGRGKFPFVWKKPRGGFIRQPKAEFAAAGAEPRGRPDCRRAPGWSHRIPTAGPR
ncbi:MAG TPA: hypothetical protein PLN93_07230 [Vicinamibacterales bacterium]|nr:hypothetical protein [Vicinamibacterales bacterium]HOG29312.1 hypothetical protein [Vicinamibacterales bacterium]HOQ59285.1 hypothetical protein [Vicinamibacterales bacterium]HPK71718.1 hypothetical protein [Vicinamibacterales bacterium]HPW21312.1 hypothetical protein [Vicinamibacterales bacterium]